MLSEFQCWIMDGKFDVDPDIMGQMLRIHGPMDNQVVPFVFCLMSTKAVYTEFNSMNCSNYM